MKNQAGASPSQLQAILSQIGKLAESQTMLVEQLRNLTVEVATEIAARSELESTFVGFGNNAMREIEQLRSIVAELQQRVEELENERHTS